MPSRMVKRSAPLRACSVKPECPAIPAQMMPVPSSMSGYMAEIGIPQERHLPPSRSQDTTGMLSHGLREAPQRGQRDRGRTTDCLGSAHHRTMQKLRKLPSTSPSTPTSTARNQRGSSVTLHLIEKDRGGRRHVKRLGAFGKRNGNHSTRRLAHLGGYTSPFVAKD